VIASRAARLGLAAVAVLAAASGCAFRTRTPEPGPREGEWAAVRDAATRRYILYDGVTHRATATATHLTPAVRESRARRLAWWKSWTDAELERQLAVERAASAAGEEFVVAFYTAQRRNNDLDAPDTIWHMAIRTGDAEVVASEAHWVASDVEVQNLFPWVGPFDVVYTIRFPPMNGGPLGDEGFVLELASALGKVPLDYDLAPIPNLPQLLPAPPERR
jgi:hypothetical protein